MDNLDMCITLLEQAKSEKERYNEYKKVKNGGAPWDVLEKLFGNEPHKSDVNDRIRLVRKLLLKEYVE